MSKSQKQQGFLATFRIDEELWGKFKNIAKNKQTNASALIIQFIQNTVGGIDTPQNIDNSCQLSVHDIDSRIDEKIKASIQDINTPSIQNIENLIDSRIGGSIADGDIRYAIAHSYKSSVDQFNEMIGDLQNQIGELKKQFEELSVSPPSAPVPPSAIDNSPAPADNSPAPEIPHNKQQIIRAALSKKNTKVSSAQIRQAFYDAGWDGNNFEAIRKDIEKLLGGDK